jgi:hypothetical protein
MTSITSSNKMASGQRFSIFKLSIYSNLDLLSVCLVLCFSFLLRPKKISSKKTPHYYYNSTFKAPTPFYLLLSDLDPADELPP